MLSIRYNSCIKSWRNKKRFTKNIKNSAYIINWKGINYPSEIDDWKQFEKNSPMVALNVFFFSLKKKQYIL